MVNSFDTRIMLFVNQFVHRSYAFDQMMVYASEGPLLTGGVVMALLWWAWGQSREERKDRETIIFALLGSIFVGLLARALALTIPFRVRPLHNLELHLRLPYGLDPSTLIGWSSFPSDHAAVYFCLATGVWLVSRQLGIIAIADAALIICFPRLYEGIHYPTDLIAGAALGIGVASLVRIDRLRIAVMRPVWSWHEQYPGPFYALLFLFSAEVGSGFALVRDLLKGSVHLLQSNGFALR